MRRRTDGEPGLAPAGGRAVRPPLPRAARVAAESKPGLVSDRRRREGAARQRASWGRPGVEPGTSGCRAPYRLRWVPGRTADGRSCVPPSARSLLRARSWGHARSAAVRRGRAPRENPVSGRVSGRARAVHGGPGLSRPPSSAAARRGGAGRRAVRVRAQSRGPGRAGAALGRRTAAFLDAGRVGPARARAWPTPELASKFERAPPAAAADSEAGRRPPHRISGPPGSAVCAGPDAPAAARLVGRGPRLSGPGPESARPVLRPPHLAALRTHSAGSIQLEIRIRRLTRILGAPDWQAHVPAAAAPRLLA